MKQIIFILTLLVVGMFAFIGCSDDKAEINKDFQVDSDQAEYDSATNTLHFKGKRNTAQITVVTQDATGKWDARCPTDDLWCSFTKSGDKLVVTVDNNTTDKSRTSHITIILGGTERTVNVVQDYIYNLNFVTGSLNVGAISGDYTIGITTNIAAENIGFEVQDADGKPIAVANLWIKNIEYADGIVKFSVDKNHDKTGDRTAVIVAQAKDDEVNSKFIVTQNMASGTAYTVSLENLNYEFDDNTYIYEIWDNTNHIKVGNICREYLLKATSASDVAVRAVGVVVYPVKNGVVDHVNGFVIATIDNETGRVTADGGEIMWNNSITSHTAGSDMIATYVPGKLSAMPQSIYMPLGGSKFTTDELDAEDKQDAVAATITPWLVTDRREGASITGRDTYDEFKYGVVKVGCQYWFAQNLKTTRFKDGTPIPTNHWAKNPTSAEPMCALTGYPKATSTAATFTDANSMDATAQAVRNETGPVYNYFTLFNATMPNFASAYTGPVVDMLSPTGWGVPTKDEFLILSNYITQCSAKPTSDPKLELMLATLQETTATNITGFGAEGFRYKTTSGSNSKKGTLYATIDTYRFDVAGTGVDSDHTTTAFCCGIASDETFISADVCWGIFVRCIKRE